MGTQLINDRKRFKIIEQKDRMHFEEDGRKQGSTKAYKDEVKNNENLVPTIRNRSTETLRTA